MTPATDLEIDAGTFVHDFKGWVTEYAPKCDTCSRPGHAVFHTGPCGGPFGLSFSMNVVQREIDAAAPEAAT